MKKIYVVAVLAGIAGYALGKYPGERPIGSTLYLNRSIETKRAEFVYQGDCELIAKNMQKAEPMVSWYCR